MNRTALKGKTKIWRLVAAWLLPGLLLAAATTTEASFSLAPERLRCEYLENALGLEETSPRLSWILTSEQRGQRQTAYQLLVASSEALLQQD